jgi:hypothetical protein
MLIQATINLHHLHCITPTDPSGEDEPYLWAFFIRTDGLTVRQSTVAPGRLSANIDVHSGPGRPGNLSEAKATSGSNIAIPPAVGTHSTDLRPIVLRFSGGGITYRFFLPGILTAFALLIDEDSAPRDAMEGAHADVKALVKQRTDDFFNALDLQPIFDQAWLANQASGVQSVFDAALGSIGLFIFNQTRQFINGTPGTPGLVQEMTDAAIQSAEISTMADAGFLEQLFGALDPDEPVGGALIQLSDAAIIASNLALSTQNDLRQSQTGLGGAWYVLYDSKFATLGFGQVDAVVVTSSAPPVIAQTSLYTFTQGKLCVPNGPIQWTRSNHVQTYDVSIQYPFIAFRYKIDGQILGPGAGVATVTKQVDIPEFDPTTYEFVRFVPQTRNAQIAYSRARQNNDRQIEHLILTNNPADGVYWVTLDVEGVLPNGQPLPAGQVVIFFEGQTIELPKGFIDSVNGCLAPLTSNRFSKWKRVGPKELWGPYGRFRRYEALARLVDTVGEVRGRNPAITDALKSAIAARLNVQREAQRPGD